ncbi:GMC oxidoreductase [Cenococcum geophilum]
MLRSLQSSYHPIIMFGVIKIVGIFFALQARTAPLFGGQTVLFSNHFGLGGENATYDYVIIGGGTAGLTLATRLAEDESISVAIVEAGDFYEKDHGNRSVVPGYWVGSDVGTDASLVHTAPLVDWAYLTTPQTALGNTVYHYPRGRCLGGTSARNAMVYQRGTAGSYDQWASAVGDDSYKFQSFLPYFRKSAHYTAPNVQIRAANASVPSPNSTAYIATGGPLEVSHANWAMPFSSWALPALAEVGISALSDLNSGNLLGVQYSATSIKPDDQTRSSSESSFLQAAFGSNRTNLKTATGIRASSYGSEYIISANNEVILSGGAFGSPQILMVSGVGPKEELSKYDIPVLADRPGVGKGMWDHVLFSITYQVDVVTQSQLTDLVYKAQADEEYIKNATGILTSMAADMLAFEKLPETYRANLSSASKKDLGDFASDWPEVEYVVSSTAYSDALPGKNYASTSAGIVAPLSRGTVTIQSNDTAVQPLIDPGWFTNSTDIEVAVQAFKRMREIWAAKAIQGVLLSGELDPGPSVQTDEEIKEYILNTTRTIYHPACTCKMGRRNDTMAVVDSKAKVIGVQGLRVVDAAAFPLLPPGHPQATIYGLAEKIADDILKGHQKR